MTVDRERVARAISDLLVAIGRDPAGDDELADTPRRVADLYADELLVGEGRDPIADLRANRIDGRAGTVVARALQVATICPHHLLPTQGTATLAFGADRHIVGVGALARLVDTAARRLALQETIGEVVADAIERVLEPRFVVCHLRLRHACMTMRRARDAHAIVETWTLRGKIDHAQARAIVGETR